MLCERCGKNEAEVHLVKMVNGERHIEHVCRRCARELLPNAGRSMRMSLSLEGFAGLEDALKEMLSPLLPELYAGSEGDLHCPSCGAPLPAELFEKQAQAPDDEALQELCRIDCDELTDLKNELRRAVREEDYERAAELRDRLKTMQSEKDE